MSCESSLPCFGRVLVREQLGDIVTLLAQAEREQRASPAAGGRQGSLHVRCEGRLIYPYSCFTFSPTQRCSWGWGGRSARTQRTWEPTQGKHRQRRLARAGLTTDPGGLGGGHKRGAGLRRTESDLLGEQLLAPASLGARTAATAQPIKPALRHLLCWPGLCPA